MWFFPLRGRKDHGLLCINHEFGTNPHVLGGDPDEFPGEELEKVRISQAAPSATKVPTSQTRCCADQ